MAIPYPYRSSDWYGYDHCCDTPLPNRFDYLASGLFDGDGARVYFADSLTNLDGANNYGIPNAYIYGSSLTSSDNGYRSDYKCTTNNPPSSYQQYSFSRELPQDNGVGKLVSGTFYVNFGVSKGQTGGSQQYVDTYAAVDYRENNTTSWTRARDIDNNLTYPGAQWNQVYGGMVSVSSSSHLLRLFNQAGFPTGTGISGGRYFAYDKPGEYRITIGALHGPILSYASCSSAQTTNDDQYLETGNFNATGPFYYRISNVNANCSSTINNTTYYAKEFIAKYVKQLYTNSAMTTPASLTAGTYRYARYNGTGSTATVSNLENTKGGAYTATFSSTGERTSASTPCLFT